MGNFSDRNSRKAKITAFYALSLTKFYMEPHSHDSCEIMYVTSGSCLVEYEGKQVRLTPGRFVFLDAQVCHRLKIQEGSSCSVLNLEFRWGEEGEIDLDQIIRNSPGVKRIVGKKVGGFEGDDLNDLGYSLKDLITYLQRDRKKQEYLLTVLFYRFLLELAAGMEEDRKRAGAAYLRKACGYIEENLASDLKVSKIAAHAGINKSYLQFLFSKFLDCTITAYINQKRIEQASFLLINSAMRVTDIAFYTGFNSRQHFGVVFEKYHKMSPMKYRKLHSRALAPDTEGKQYVLHSMKAEQVVLQED